MRKGVKCVAQTINLSNPETCIRPAKIQKLVSANVMQPCPSTEPGSSSYWTPRPVAVKVCTSKDMRRICPPKLCDCPQKPKPRTASQQFCRALLFLLKSSIAAGLVYWTHSEGLWGSSADAENLYYRILATIAPVLPNGDDVDLPSMVRLKYNMIQRYNRTVYTVTNCILNTTMNLQEQFRNLFSRDEEIVEESVEDLSKVATRTDKKSEKNNGN